MLYRFFSIFFCIMIITPLNYAQTFTEIKQLVIQARHQALYKVNIELIMMYIHL